MVDNKKKATIRDSRNIINANVVNVDQELVSIEFSQSEYENGVYMRGTQVSVKSLSLEGCYEYGKKVLKDWKPRRKNNIKTAKGEYIG